MAAIILVGGFGCAKPTPGNYLEAWDGQATEWEVPPARSVTAADAGTGAIGDPGGGGGLVGSLPVCARQGQPNCCYEDKPGAPSGIPRCTWRRLGPGEATIISAASLGPEKIALPVAVHLSGATPERFATYDECLNSTIGFVLSAPGMAEGPLGGDIAHYDLKADGTWVGRGGGGASGFVAGRDPQASRDGGPPAPRYTLHEGLCKPLMTPEFVASIHLFDQVNFELEGKQYKADFKQHPNGQVTGYYVLIQKGF